MSEDVLKTDNTFYNVDYLIFIYIGVCFQSDSIQIIFNLFILQVLITIFYIL